MFNTHGSVMPTKECKLKQYPDMNIDQNLIAVYMNYFWYVLYGVRLVYDNTSL